MSRKSLMITLAATTMLVATSSLASARSVYITGSCVCKKGNNVLATYSSRICAANTHDNCTAAKQACTTESRAACTDLGGILTQSGQSCNIGDKC